MPGRDPKARRRSALIGEEIRAELKHQRLTGAELLRLLEKHWGRPAAADRRSGLVWMSRRVTGHVNLIQPVKVIYGPTQDLLDIAEVLNVDPERFMRVLNEPATIKDPQEPTTPAAAG